MSGVQLRVRLARSVHRLLRRLAPADIRRLHGDELADTFEDLAEAAAARGWLSTGALLAHEAVDLRRARRLSPHHARPDERNVIVSLLTTLADWRTIGRSIRALWRRPAFAVTAVLTLGLGSAATTALFSVVDTALVKALPYPEPDRLVTVMEASKSATSKVSLIAPVRLEDWQRMNRTFEALSGVYSDTVTDTTGATPERLQARDVTPRYFAVYGASPILGRTFEPNEEFAGGPKVAVLSEAFWTRRFARDPGALGKTLHIGTGSWTIVGVMPTSFTSAPVDAWLPAQLLGPGGSGMSNRLARFLNGVGRLKPGVTIAQAQDDLDRVQRELGAEFPASDANWATAVSDLKTYRIGDRAQPLWLLFGAVGLLWMIALANVAALVLVEMRRRHTELAVRAALGASRGRLIGGVLQEVALLSVTAGALGAAGATWIVAVIKATFITLPRVNELAVDGRALAFSAITILAAALVCGGVPAALATRRVQSEVTRSGRGVARGAHRVQRILVVAQVALSVLLCVSAMLLVRSYDNLTRVDTGFTSAGVYTFHVGARWGEDRTAISHLQERLVEDIGRQPGVTAVGLANFLPQSGATLRYQVKVAGVAGTDPNGYVTAGSRSVGADYFKALNIPIVSGAACPSFRSLEALTYDPDAISYDLVNRRFVTQFANGENLVGRSLRMAQYPQALHTIIGVVGDVSEDSAAADVVPYVYSCLHPGDWPDPEYVVRLSAPAAFGAALRPLVRNLDPTRAVFGYQPLEDVLRTDTEEPRMDAGLTTLFASTALGLSAIGLYGLFMLIVSESRREIGVRLALGAAPRQMIGLVCVSAGRLLVAGLVIGLALTAGAGRVLRTLLYGISSHDAVTMAVATITLAVVSMAAITLPALRAARVPPTEALRE